MKMDLLAANVLISLFIGHIQLVVWDLDNGKAYIVSSNCEFDLW
jgi:hypothetical protein